MDTNFVCSLFIKMKISKIMLKTCCLHLRSSVTREESREYSNFTRFMSQDGPRAASHAYWWSRYCHTNGCGLIPFPRSCAAALPKNAVTTQPHSVHSCDHQRFLEALMRPAWMPTTFESAWAISLNRNFGSVYSVFQNFGFQEIGTVRFTK